MNEKQHAAEEFLTFANRLRGMVNFAEYVKTIGDLEQNEKELRGLVSQHEANLTDLRDRLQETKDQTQAESAGAREIREQAQQDAESCLKSAATTANQKLVDAEQQTLEILAQGNLRLKDVMAKVSAGETRLVDLGKEILTKEYRLKTLKDEMTELAKKHLG